MASRQDASGRAPRKRTRRGDDPSLAERERSADPVESPVLAIAAISDAPDELHHESGPMLLEPKEEPESPPELSPGSPYVAAYAEAGLVDEMPDSWPTPESEEQTLETLQQTPGTQASLEGIPEGSYVTLEALQAALLLQFMSTQQTAYKHQVPATSARQGPARPPLQEVGNVQRRPSPPPEGELTRINILSPIDQKRARELKRAAAGHLDDQKDVGLVSHMEAQFFVSPQGTEWRCLPCIVKEGRIGWAHKLVHCIGLSDNLPRPVCPGICHQTPCHTLHISKCKHCAWIFFNHQASIKDGAIYASPALP